VGELLSLPGKGGRRRTLNARTTKMEGISPELIAWVAIIAAIVAVAAQLKWHKAVSGKNRDKARYGAGLLCIGLLVFGGAAGTLMSWVPSGDDVAPPGDDDVIVTPTACSVECSSTGLTALVVDVDNTLSTTTANYDVTMLCKSDSGTISLTDTTSPDSEDFNCGETYECKILSETGAGGDTSIVKEIKAGNAVVTSDRNLRFTACGPSMSLRVGSEVKGAVQTRAWDLNAAAWMYVNASTTAWSSTDGTVYMGTADNSTATAVGSGGNIRFKLQIQPTAVVQNLNDRGILIGIDAAPNVWDADTVLCKIDGQTVQSNKAVLNSDEQTAFSDYEYMYLIDKSVVQPDYMELDCTMTAVSGVDPGASDSPALMITMRGHSASNSDPTQYIVSAVQDNAAKTAVHTQHGVTIQVS
jgi:hypothetical protein